MPICPKCGHQGPTVGTKCPYDDYYFVRRNCPEPPGMMAPEMAPAFVTRERGVMAPGE